jgi:DNA-binding NtrC family response regulator
VNRLRILVVEDDKLAQKVMGQNLAHHAVEFAGDLESARSKLANERFDLCFIDLNLGPGDECSGLKVIPLAAEKRVYSVVMTGMDTEDMIGRAYELGCQDFYAKGNEAANAGAVIAKYFQKRSGFNSEHVFAHQFITEDPATRASIAEAAKYAPTDLPILILGPSGTGKTSLGKMIHEHSLREGEFVAINCSAYTEELLEAELFGFKRGAFTGATEARKGKLLRAHKGTLFLDEIGAMSLNMQTKLLKAIEERSFHPLGAEAPESSDFRIVSATLEDLQSLIARGRLRFDFFQRIHGLTVALRPLNRRKCDIFPLVEFFTRGSRRLCFTEEAKSCLLDYDWPGNTRELRKLVRLLVSGAEGRVSREDVQRHLSRAVPRKAGGFVDDAQYAFAVERGLDKALERFSSEIIRRNLSENGGVKVKTLSNLGISTRALYAALKQDLLEPDDGRQA